MALMLLVCLWAINLVRVFSVANAAPTDVGYASHVVVLGKRLANGQVDEDFQARLDRASQLLLADPSRWLVISGGGDGVSEASAGLADIQSRIEHSLDPARVMLEEASRSTAENMNNIRALIPTGARATIVSSRYHLARIDRLSRGASIQVDLVAAEPHLAINFLSVAYLAKEATYMTALDLAAIFV